MINQTALLFAGQGAQAVGMGQDLAERFPEARAWFEQANAVLGYDLAAICFQGPEPELTKTEHAQPGIYLVSWVAFQLLKTRCPAMDFGATAGLSLGEFTALAAVGVMGFAEGLRMVRQRGRFMQQACEATRGGMAAIIGLDTEATQAVCVETGVELANLNCPGQLVISGATEAIVRACDLARTRGAKRAVPLTVAGAYHSRLMASAQSSLKAILEAMPLQPPRAPVVSNVTAQPHGSVVQIREQLVKQVTAPVQWEASMRYLLAQGFTRFIELGPGRTLAGFMKRIDPKAAVLNVSDTASLEATVTALA